MLETNILICLFEPSFQGVNRLFILKFNANDSKIGHSRYYLPTEKVEEYNVMINGADLFDQPIKNDTKTSGPGDDSTTGCLLDYNYFTKNYKMIEMNLSKQKALAAEILLEIYVVQIMDQYFSLL